jgi:DNA-nicking Smr family endonuclease
MGSPPDAAGEPLRFLRDGHSPDLLRRLRRGHWRVEDELDLHGMNRHQAAFAVEDFLRDSVRRSLGCVRIIHGKGQVLREMLRVSLPARKDLLAAVQAPDVQGGSGAVLLLLRK